MVHELEAKVVLRQKSNRKRRNDRMLDGVSTNSLKFSKR